MKRLAPLLLTLPCLLAHAAPQENDPVSIAITFENDVFVNSDDNYTDGLQYAWAHHRPAQNKADQWAISTACRYFGCDAKQAVTTTSKIGQLMYTPTDIFNPAPQPDDHPWAGMLYYQRSYDINVSDKESINVGGLIGIIGPHSFAEQTQRFIHRHITDSPDPQGWHNQIGNAVGVMASIEKRKSIGFLFNRPDKWDVNSAWYWRAAVGNVMTYAATGLSFKFGRKQAFLVKGDNFGISTKSTATFEGKDSEERGGGCLSISWLGCSLTANLEARAVAYNMFLDGRWGHPRDPSVDSRVLVGEASVGLKLTLPEYRIANYGTPFIRFQITQRTPEYRSPKSTGAQAWGAITIGTDFP